jgi:MFS family permease
VGLALLAIGYGGVVPASLGMLSRLVDEDVQGGTLGVGQSVGSLARVAGPFVAGVAFDPIWRAEINESTFVGPVVTMVVIVGVAVCYPAIKAAAIHKALLAIIVRDPFAFECAGTAVMEHFGQILPSDSRWVSGQTPNISDWRSIFK